MKKNFLQGKVWMSVKTGLLFLLWAFTEEINDAKKSDTVIDPAK